MNARVYLTVLQALRLPTVNKPGRKLQFCNELISEEWVSG